MKKILFLLILVAFKSFAALEGTFEGLTCQSYNDNAMWGTYNYKFSGDFVETYIQYYEDESCSKRLDQTADHSRGNYMVTSAKLGIEEVYKVTITYNKSNCIKRLRMSVIGNTLNVWDHNNDHLGTYQRHTNAK